MPSINSRSVKIAMLLIGIAVLLEIPLIMLDGQGYDNFIIIFQCPLYLYNYWFFRKFLKEELDYHKLTFIIAVFTIAILLLAVVCLLNIVQEEETNEIMVIYFFFLLLLFSNIPYAIKLYRIESDIYRGPLSIVATGALISLFYTLYTTLIGDAFYGDNDSIPWMDFIQSGENIGFVYLYWKAKTEMESKNYKKYEERFHLGK